MNNEDIRYIGAIALRKASSKKARLYRYLSPKGKSSMLSGAVWDMKPLKDAIPDFRKDIAQRIRQYRHFGKQGYNLTSSSRIAGDYLQNRAKAKGQVFPHKLPPMHGSGTFTDRDYTKRYNAQTAGMAVADKRRDAVHGAIDAARADFRRGGRMVGGQAQLPRRR